MDTPTSKPTRPYTEYNLFFQLEREYILQEQLGYLPNVDPTDLFDPEDTENYYGPSLPSRYAHLALLVDWHLPGKGKRRKRRHRKTHGKIGFRELSLKIAEAWKTVDDDIRLFCEEICEMGLMEYRAAMKVYNLRNSNEKNNEKIVKRKKKTKLVKTRSSNENIAPEALDYVPTDRCSMADVDAAFDNDFTLCLENLDQSMSDITQSSEKDDSLWASMVDIEDEDIIRMWKLEPQEEVGHVNDSARENDGVYYAVVEGAPRAHVRNPSARSVSFPAYAGPPGNKALFLEDCLAKSALVTPHATDGVPALIPPWLFPEELTRQVSQGSISQHRVNRIDSSYNQLKAMNQILVDQKKQFHQAAKSVTKEGGRFQGKGVEYMPTRLENFCC